MNTPSSTRASNASARERLRRVEGRHNPLVKEIRRAFSRGQLTDAGHCPIEGLRVIEEAIRSGVRFRAVLFSETGEKLASRLLPQIGSHVETLVLPDKLFAGMVDSEAPQGVAALVHYKASAVADVLNRASLGPIMVVAGLQDPGNLGTIIRSAEAFGVAGVLLGDGTVSPFNPKVVRGTAGSIFRLPIAQGKTAQILEQLRTNGVRLMATSSHKGVPLPQANLALPLAVLVGGEGAGISKDLLAKADEVVAIPHGPQVESLNAGVAASIVLYEIARKHSALSSQHSAD